MSSGHSADVNKKLKAALKAKLEELGVYVDDELPEYIMVMIANKKEKSQMKSDLNLFLGKTTGKFCDWLFELFDRLNNVNAKPGSPELKDSDATSSEKKKVKESSSRDKERERIHKKSDTQRPDSREEDREKEERERERERTVAREREKEREKERERAKDEERRRLEKEREREKEIRREREEREKEHERRKERERESRVRKPVTHTSRRDEEKRETGKARHRDRRSRSKTWSDDEFEQELDKKTKKVISSVVAARPMAASPEPVKVSSQVMVKRKIQPVADEKTAKGRSNMFMKALSEASASAGYGAPAATKTTPSASVRGTTQGPPTVAARPTRSPMKNRITAPPGREIVMDTDSVDEDEEYDSDTVVCDNKPRSAGPKITVTMKGARERIHAMLAENRNKALKRKSDNSDSSVPVEKKRTVVAPPATKTEHAGMDTEQTPARKSPTMIKWDGQINIKEDDVMSSDDDDEAEIDAVLASTQVGRTFASLDDDDVLPPTHQLSRGNSYVAYQQVPQVSMYVPTPITAKQGVQSHHGVMQVRNEVMAMDTSSGVGSTKTERCRFWPSCRQGDTCPYVHPTKTCTMFPMCSFGNRCLYVHPPCKFGVSCKNPNCSYTHGGKVLIPPSAPTYRPPATTTTDVSTTAATKIEPDVPLSVVSSEPASLASYTPCRFGGKCTKPGCHFKHPKECRFGKACFNQACYFYHPVSAEAATPNPNGIAKYKWKAAQTVTPTA